MHPSLCLITLLFFSASIAQASPATPWKLQKDQDNKCVAKYESFRGVELTPQKLTITTKETSDLKTYEVLVNDKIIAPMGRASLTDTSCKCIRIRNIEALNTENVTIRVRGQSNANSFVNTSISLQQTGAAMQALKSDICNKTQK